MEKDEHAALRRRHSLQEGRHLALSLALHPLPVLPGCTRLDAEFGPNDDACRTVEAPGSGGGLRRWELRSAAAPPVVPSRQRRRAKRHLAFSKKEQRRGTEGTRLWCLESVGCERRAKQRRDSQPEPSFYFS